MTASIKDRVIKVIEKTSKISAEDIQSNLLIADICEDSLDLVNLLFELEDEFNIDIPDEARESKSIQDIVTGIEKLMLAKQENGVGVA